MKTIRLIAALSLIIVFTTGCKKEEATENKVPDVKSYGATEITYSSALLKGEVINENGTAVTTRGFCLSENPDAGLDDLIIQVNFGPGIFDYEIDGLESGKIYYFRAFATNSTGTAFGEEKSFTTANLPGNPVIQLKEGSQYISTSAEIEVNVPALIGINGEKSESSPYNLNRLRFKAISNNVPITILDTTFLSSSISWECELTFILPGEITLLFELWDEGGFKDEVSLFVTVREDPGVAVHKYSNVQLGSFNDITGSFFSTTTGTVYTPAQLVNSPSDQALIDFLFFKGVTNYNCIASPDDGDANTISIFQIAAWANKNQTRFNATDITVAQFDAIAEEYNFPAFNMASQTTKVNNLQEGEVILFKTEEGKSGLIKIVDLFSRGDVVIIDVIVED